MRLEIVRNALQEDLLAKVSAQHPDHGTALQIADGIEDLVDFEAVIYRHFDGVRGPQRIECEGLLSRISLRACQYIRGKGYLVICDVRQIVPRRSTLTRLLA